MAWAPPNLLARTGTAKAIAVVEPRAEADRTGRWRAGAKLNLFLHVTARRADGYHCLDSLVVFTELADTIMVEAAEDLSLAITGPFAAGLPTDGRNLVMRAAELLARAAGITARGRIGLHKMLPVAAGIGGGSADAAAALLALRALWQVPIDDAGLDDLAARLGADVPVCLRAGPCMISGIGHDVAGAPALPSFALLLANPNLALATADVFKHLAVPLQPPEPWPQDPVPDLASALGRTRNDLEPAARQLAPVVGEVLAELAALPHCRLARMSGSGATCFGLFDDLSAARTGAGKLAARRKNWWIRASAVQGVG
jgi:4-diphosphocytidyl-2-C-methyl-D-erythritol kinase